MSDKNRTNLLLVFFFCEKNSDLDKSHLYTRLLQELFEILWNLFCTDFECKQLLNVFI